MKGSSVFSENLFIKNVKNVVIIFLIGSILACNDSDLPYYDKELSENVIYKRGNDLLKTTVIIPNTDKHLVHDSQILPFKQGENTFAAILYTAMPYNYVLQIYDDMHGNCIFQTKIIEDDSKKPSWSPRMFLLADYTLRILFNINNILYYRDLNLENYNLGPTFEMKVKYLISNKEYSNYTTFNLVNFEKHILNSTGININEGSFKELTHRSTYINGTDQIQFSDSVFTLNAEILFDNFWGDSGGISCMLQSTDLTNWTLKKPIYVSQNAYDNRCHEMSLTHINKAWHGLSRYNTQSISGYMSWYSENGDSWISNGISPIPGAVKGFRNSVYKGVKTIDGNLIEYAIIAYQKYFTNDNIPWNEHSSQRKSIGICITHDFKVFEDIMILNDGNFMTYPSISLLDDVIYISWSSGKGHFRENIRFAHINLASYLDFSFTLKDLQ